VKRIVLLAIAAILLAGSAVNSLPASATDQLNDVDQILTLARADRIIRCRPKVSSSATKARPVATPVYRGSMSATWARDAHATVEVAIKITARL
jgi:hypothetical protein